MHGVTSSPGKIVLLHALLIAIASMALCASRPSALADPGTIVGDRWIHLVSAGETWRTIGARVGVAPGVLAARNQRTLRVPLRPGDVIAIDNRHVAARYERDELVVNGLRALADPALVERVVSDAEGLAVAVTDTREQ